MSATGPEHTRGGTAGPFAWSPDGRSLAVALTDRVVILEDDARRAARSLPAPAASARVARLSWTADGAALVGLAAGQVWSWLLPTASAPDVRAEPIPWNDLHEVSDLACSPRDSLVAVVRHGSVSLWELQTRACVLQVPAPSNAQTPGDEVTLSDSVRSVGWSRDGDLLALGGHNHCVAVWSLKTRRQTGLYAQYGGHDSRAAPGYLCHGGAFVSFDPDGRLLVALGKYGWCSVLRQEPYLAAVAIEHLPDVRVELRGLAYHDGTRRLAVAVPGGGISVLDGATGRVERTLPRGPTAELEGWCWLEGNGALLALAANTLWRWDGLRWETVDLEASNRVPEERPVHLVGVAKTPPEPPTGGAVCNVCGTVFPGELSRCLIDGSLLVPVPNPRIGSVLEGRYLIGQRIATTARWQTYDARCRADGTRVVVKFWEPSGDLAKVKTAEVLASLELLRRLDHPNILRWRDSGLAHGKPWVALEHAAGPTLSDVLDTHSLPLRDALALARELAEGFAHAHARGVTHGAFDLRCVLFSSRGDRAVAKLNGFATIARPSEHATGLAHGMPIMALPTLHVPEQLDGAGSSTVAGDLHALGTLVYTLVTAAPPFAGEGIALAIQSATGRPRPARARNPSVPEALGALLEVMLAPDPAERTTHAAALVEVLRLCEAELLAREATAPGRSRGEELASRARLRELERRRDEEHEARRDTAVRLFKARSELSRGVREVAARIAECEAAQARRGRIDPMEPELLRLRLEKAQLEEQLVAMDARRAEFREAAPTSVDAELAAVEQSLGLRPIGS